MVPVVIIMVGQTSLAEHTVEVTVPSDFVIVGIFLVTTYVSNFFVTIALGLPFSTVVYNCGTLETKVQGCSEVRVVRTLESFQ